MVTRRREALIVHKRGEAEAAALEMGADAYRHFNGTAIQANHAIKGLTAIDVPQ